MRGADHPTSKSQPPRAKAPRGRDFARACHDGPIAIVRHAAVHFVFAAALSFANCRESVREMWERAMRAGIIASCFALALLVGGCDPARDFRYTREGIGTDLYWDGLPAATQLQDIYLANMCAQAISPTARSLDPLSCDGLNLASRDWGLLVQAGMNDVDLRCDSYLSWLHDKKSSREPILKELAVLGGAAAAILRATDVGATPIALTAIAFGIAAESFTNYDLRILNGVDYTTVQSVVRGNRTQFRANNLSLVIDNRPAAIYVLRNYLSICLPASIEMSINNTVNVFHRGGPEALRAEQVGLRTPVATAATSATVRGTPMRAQTATQVIERRDTGRVFKRVEANLAQFFEETLSQTEAERSLNALCLNKNPVTDSNKVDFSRVLVKIYKSSGDADDAANLKITGREREKILKQVDCGPAQNYFERKNFANTISDQAKRLSIAGVVSLVDFLNRAGAGGNIEPATTLAGARAKIKAVRFDQDVAKQLTIQVPVEFDGQVTPDFFAVLRTLPPK